MITFEQAKALPVGSSIYQAVGWRDNRPTSFAEFEISAIHQNSIDLVALDFVWGRNVRLNRSDFPLVYWSVENV